MRWAIFLVLVMGSNLGLMMLKTVPGHAQTDESGACPQVLQAFKERLGKDIRRLQTLSSHCAASAAPLADSPELEQTKRELEATKGDLEATKRELVDTKGNLEATKRDLIASKADLATTGASLLAAKGDLEGSKRDLATAEHRADGFAAKLTEEQRREEQLRADLADDTWRGQQATARLVAILNVRLTSLLQADGDRRMSCEQVAIESDDGVRFSAAGRFHDLTLLKSRLADLSKELGTSIDATAVDQVVICGTPIGGGLSVAFENGGPLVMSRDELLKLIPSGNAGRERVPGFAECAAIGAVLASAAPAQGDPTAKFWSIREGSGPDNPEYVLCERLSDGTWAIREYGISGLRALLVLREESPKQ